MKFLPKVFISLNVKSQKTKILILVIFA